MSEIKLSGKESNRVQVSNSLARYYSDLAEGFAKASEKSAIKSENYFLQIEALMNSIEVNIEEGKSKLDAHTLLKKEELNTFAEEKKSYLNTFTEEKKTELEVNSETLKGIFDTNYTNKTNDFNTNAERKQTEVDNSAKAAKLSEENAKASETNARKYANGTIEEYPDGSAKYYAEKAAEIVGKGIIQDDKVALDTTYSSQKIEERLEESGGVKTLPIHVNPINPEEFYVDNTAEEIRKMVYEQSRDVRLSFEDTITNTGEQLYDFETFDKQNYAVFRRNVIDSDTAERINIKVGNDKKVTFNITPYNGLLTDGSKTMTGALKFEDSGYIEKNASPSTKGLALFGDKAGYGNGASIALRSNSASGSQAGAFKFETGNNVTGHTHTLQGSPDGSFTCDGKEIIRSINGEVADSTGNIEVQAGGSYPIGAILPSLQPINDVNFHLFDGSLLVVGGTYDQFINKYIADLKVSNPECFITEEEFQQEINAHGVCGKFVYTRGVSVRLPKLTGILQGTVDNDGGSIVEAGLPNIEGDLRGGVANAGTPTGAFYRRTSNAYGGSGAGATQSFLMFDASRSNPIYGKSNTVQPQTTKVYYYICVSSKTKTDIQSNIDNIATDLNNKADRDLTNVTANIDVVIDSKINPDGSWYRKYKSGWLEQGGVMPREDNSVTVVLLKPYSNNNYTLVMGTERTGHGSGLPNCVYENKTTTSFVCAFDYVSSNRNKGGSWYACGQGV